MGIFFPSIHRCDVHEAEHISGRSPIKELRLFLGTKVTFLDVEIVYEAGWGCVRYVSIMLRKVEAEKGLRRKSFAPDWIALS